MSDSRYSGAGFGLALLGIFLALGLIISTIVLSGAINKIKSTNEFITVKGYAEKKIVSDLGIWWGSLSVRSTDLVTAYNKLQGDLNKTIAYLNSKGISRQNIDITSINTIKEFRLTEKGQVTNQVEGYNLTQSIKVTSNNVKLIESISNESTTLIQQGIEIMSNQPQYFYTKINDLKIQMLGEATKDARQRAEQLAVNSGSRVGSLRSASQGVFQITPVNSTEVSDMGEYNLTTIEKSIKAVVTIDFSIK